MQVGIGRQGGDGGRVVLYRGPDLGPDGEAVILARGDVEHLLMDAGHKRGIELEPLLRPLPAADAVGEVAGQGFFEFGRQVGGVVVGVVHPPGGPAVPDVDFVDAVPAVEAVLEAGVLQQVGGLGLDPGRGASRLRAQQQRQQEQRRYDSSSHANLLGVSVLAPPWSQETLGEPG